MLKYLPISLFYIMLFSSFQILKLYFNFWKWLAIGFSLQNSFDFLPFPSMFIFILCEFAWMYVYVIFVCVGQRMVSFSGTWVSESCPPPCGFWPHNLHASWVYCSCYTNKAMEIWCMSIAWVHRLILYTLLSFSAV